MIPRLIVHGGAWNIPRDQHQAHIQGCRRAVQKIYPMLAEGASALDAVEQAVRELEEDPTFDAGRGAFLNAAGEVELDAIICDGRNLDFGAVAAIQNILHPVSAARLVMEKSEHCLIVGTGAQKFLRGHNFPETAVEELLTKRELRFYRKIKSDPAFTTRKPFEPHPMDTVGAVALDGNGNFAAATSTGGTPRKLPGRVGDSPIIGAGAYADNRCGAVSATGFGESILKVLLAKQLCDGFNNAAAMPAARSAISLLEQKVGGLGGVIGISSEGEYGFHHNTECMALAFHHPENGVVAGIDVHSLKI